MRDTIVERTTTAVAGAWILSPVWIPALKDASEIAELVLPTLGVVWLIVQIITKIMRQFRPR